MATKYVSTTGTNSGAGGIGAPWQTLAYAMNTAANGDEIQVYPGNYPEVPYLGYVSGKVLTVKRKTGETDAVTVNPTISTSRLIDGNASVAAGSKVTFEDIVFRPAATSVIQYAAIYKRADCEVDLRFTRCTIDLDTNSPTYSGASATLVYIAGRANTVNKLYFTDCTVLAANTGATQMMNIRDIHTLSISGGTWTHRADASAAEGIAIPLYTSTCSLVSITGVTWVGSATMILPYRNNNADLWFTSIVLSNNTVSLSANTTNTSFLSTASTYTSASKINSQIKDLLVSGNTVTLRGGTGAAPSSAVRVAMANCDGTTTPYASYGRVRVLNNTFTLADNAAADQTGLIIHIGEQGTETLKVGWISDGITVKGNTIRYAGVGSGTHAVLLGAGVIGGVFAENDINTYASVGLVLKGCNYLDVRNNVVVCTQPCLLKGQLTESTTQNAHHNTIHHNTFYAIKQDADAVASVIGFYHVPWTSNTTYHHRPRNNWIEDNIIVASGSGAYAFKDEGYSAGPTLYQHGGNVYRRNVYWAASSAKLATMGGADKETMTALQAYWDAIAADSDALTVPAGNESDSDFSDPQFVNASGGDLSVFTSSPAKATAARLWQQLGAYGYKPKPTPMRLGIGA